MLLVDDVEDIRLLLRLCLSGPDFEIVAEAGDGHEAVALARSHRPDLIVLDVVMPRMDGLQAIPLLHEAAPGTKIVVLSGFEDATLAKRAVGLCASVYLRKGTPPSHVVRTLRGVHAAPAKCPPSTSR
ncbi:MAG: response regulator [Actinomycetota bacterium]